MHIPIRSTSSQLLRLSGDLFRLAVSGTGIRTGSRTETWTKGCIVLCRTFHTPPELRQGPTPIVHHCSGSGPGLGTEHRWCDHDQCNNSFTNTERLFANNECELKNKHV